MMGLTNRPGMIGLDIGRRWVKAAQLTGKGASRSAHALAVFDRRQPDAPVTVGEAGHIAEVLRRRGFRGSRVVLSAPPGALVSSLLDLPPAKAEVPRERIIRAELSRVHKLAPDGFSCCWSDLPSSANGGGGAQALCWGLRYDMADAMLSALTSAGLEVVGVEPTSLALHRACRPMIQNDEQISAVADLGASSARLVLLYRGRVVHERLLPEWGGGALVRAISEKLEAPEVLAERAMCRYGMGGAEQGGLLASETTGTLAGMLDEMVEQVSLSFSFVSHQYPEAELGPLILTGGGSGMPGLAPALAEGLQLQVVPLTPGVMVEGTADRASGCPSVVAALGLAMKGAKGDG